MFLGAWSLGGWWSLRLKVFSKINPTVPILQKLMEALGDESTCPKATGYLQSHTAWILLLFTKGRWWHSDKESTWPMWATQEMWVQSLGWEDPLRQKMATRSRVLSWKNPWTEEPGSLKSVRKSRVRHIWTQHSSSQVAESNTTWRLVVLGTSGFASLSPRTHTARQAESPTQRSLSSEK